MPHGNWWPANLLVGLTILLPEGGEGQTGVRVHIDTDMGRITAEIDTARAPITAVNFLKYVDMGMYTDGTFYRAVRLDNQPDNEVKIEVIQGGIARSRREDRLPPIPMEPTGETGILHLDGVLSMARSGPETAQGEFFISVGSQPELNQGGVRNPDGWGFAAFGRVVEGMSVVRAIQSRRTEGQYFPQDERIRIIRIQRTSPPG